MNRHACQKCVYNARMTTWDEVHARLAAELAGTVVVVPKAEIEPPASAGAKRSFGMFVGQTADWRFPPDAQKRGLHVEDFGDAWRAHLDEKHPDCDLLEHVRRDVPGPMVFYVAMAAGAAVGAWLDDDENRMRGTLYGVAGGALVALLLEWRGRSAARARGLRR